MSTPQQDLTRTIFAVLITTGLIAGCFLVMAPFLLALVWATAIVVATWPLMTALQRRVGGRRWLAVTIITLLLLLMLVVPLTAAITSIIDHVDDLTMLSAKIADFASLPPPDWLHNLPASQRLIDTWTAMSQLTPQELQAKFTPYANGAVNWVVNKAGSLTMMVVQFLLTIGLCALLYMTGETAANGVRRFARRLAGERGDNSVILASQAVRAVALGVVVTALVQAVLAAIGLLIAGIPFVGLLTAVVLMSCIAQLGVFLVLIPATIWLFYSGDTGLGVFLLIWTLVVGALDNFLRPWLISRGADLPLALILSGVIGGLLAFGIIGLFVGPVLLAVSYRLVEAWVDTPGNTATP